MRHGTLSGDAHVFEHVSVRTAILQQGAHDARRTTHDAWDPLFIADYYSGNTYSTLNIMLTRADSIV